MTSAKNILPQDSIVLLTSTQVATLLKIRVETLYNARSQGRSTIPFIRVGTAIRYRYTDVLAFLDANTEIQTQ